MKRKNILISIIITTKNEEAVLAQLLKSITSQLFKNYEIILVDNNSTDKTKKIAAEFTTRVYNKGPERSIQRNYGVSKALGSYVLILDADMILQKNVLSEIVAKFDKSKSIGALVIPEKSFGIGYWAKVKAFEREFYLGDESIEAARAFRKSIFIKFDGYDSKITGPEDIDLPMRIRKSGIKINRTKSFILHNEKELSPLKSARKKYYYAKGSIEHLKKHPEAALTQGNLLFRPVFFRKWKKLLKKPHLTLGLFVMRTLEMVGALLGIAHASIHGR